MTFHLGGAVGDDGERIPGADIAFDSSDLTTHGVIIGMTGSGKTGLGVVYLEEALRSGIPALILDPKGDMTNLLLTFPDLAPGDFRPWIDETAAARSGRSPDDEAESVARTWRDGLAAWGLDGGDIRALRDASAMTIYTPGSTAGVPIDIVGDLSAPDLPWDTEAETIRDAIQGYVSGLLGLIDIDADPIASREHILLSNLIEHAWRSDTDIDLARLISWIIAPPVRKLGVFDVDDFYPEKDRTGLAMRLNGLLASPSFASWMDGQPLDIESLLWHDGRPAASIVYLAHLSDQERQFMVTAILTRVITWMRSQPGASELRALIYMDEVFGFVPPTAEPPAKRPILTLLKQGRAFGVGLLLSTQNPVDLDYKAMSNAGTWCIGRLQTERDKARVLEAVTTASGDVDIASIDALISGLGKRRFLLHSTRDARPALFTTRWAMSYLRGPMTREEVASLTPASVRRPEEPSDGHRPDDGRPEPVPDGRPDERSTSRTPAPPPSASGIPVAWLDPAAPWVGTVGYDPDGDHYEPIVALAVSVHYDESRIGFAHTDTFEAVMECHRQLRPEDLIQVDHDPRDFRDTADPLPYTTTETIDDPGWFTDVRRFVTDHLDRHGEVTAFRHRDLDLVSRPDETRDGFIERVHVAAGNAADAEMAELRTRYERRILSARRDYEDAVRDADDAAEAAEAARSDALLGAGLDLLMGRKPKLSRTGGRSADARLAKAETRVERTRADYEDLGHDLEREAEEIADRWSDAERDVEEIRIGVERDDLRIEALRLVWVRR